MKKRAYSPKEILNIKLKKLPLEGKWEEALGQPGMYETWIVHGQSASGKSSFMMQLAKMLCELGRVLYLNIEEGVSPSFQERIERFKMQEVQGRFRTLNIRDLVELKEKLKKPKSPNFIIVDSFQKTGWSYEDTVNLIESFPRKSFIFVSQEYKSEPLGKPAIRLKYDAGVKIRTIGFRAYCQGRFTNDAAVYYTIWKDGEIRHWNNIKNK